MDVHTLKQGCCFFDGGGHKVWYVIWTLTGKEEELIAQVRKSVPEEKYEQIWTPYKEWIKKSNGCREIRRSLIFPGYVFVNTDDPQTIHTMIKKERSCLGFLKSDGEFVQVREDEKKIIEFFMGDKGVAGVSLCLLENNRLKVIDGPLKGMDDRIYRLERSKNQVWVRLPNIFGRDWELSFAVEIVERE